MNWPSIVATIGDYNSAFRLTFRDSFTNPKKAPLVSGAVVLFRRLDPRASAPAGRAEEAPEEVKEVLARRHQVVVVVRVS